MLQVAPRSTSDEEKSPAATNLRDKVRDAAESDGALVKVDPPPHGVHHGLGLLEYLLLHEGGEAPLHHHDNHDHYDHTMIRITFMIC